MSHRAMHHDIRPGTYIISLIGHLMPTKLPRSSGNFGHFACLHFLLMMVLIQHPLTSPAMRLRWAASCIQRHLHTSALFAQVYTYKFCYRNFCSSET